VVTGRYDINVAPSVAYKIHKAIAGSQFVVLEKSGHLAVLRGARGVRARGRGVPRRRPLTGCPIASPADGAVRAVPPAVLALAMRRRASPQ
jgi:hypothetical protein